MRILFVYLWLGWATLLLTSCFPTRPAEIKRAACRDLKSKIIFNAATTETRRAGIERAEQPLQERTYDANNCDEH